MPSFSHDKEHTWKTCINPPICVYLYEYAEHIYLFFLNILCYAVTLKLSNLSRMLRYVAYAFGLVFSYMAQLHEGREFSPLQSISCFGIALLAVVTWL